MKHAFTAADEHKNHRRLHQCARCRRQLWVPVSGKIVSPGECYAWPYVWEVGNIAELLLAAIGITKARYARHKDCGSCDQRQAALNTAGESLADYLKPLWKFVARKYD